MFFFNKKSSIVLDCFTTRENVQRYAPIEHGHHFYPEWWKNLAKTVPAGPHAATFGWDMATIKLCRGFIDWYQDSIVLPMWSDFRIVTKDDGTYYYAFADGISVTNYHDERQFHGMFTNGSYNNLKLITPWLFSCKEDIKFVAMSSFYNRDTLTDFIVMPGVVDFKNQNNTNVNLLLEKKESMMSISLNTPIMLFHPKTDKKIVIKNHVVDEKEYNRILNQNNPPKYFGRYKLAKELNNKKSGCPFHF